MSEVRAGAIPTLSGNAVYTRLDADRTTAAAVVDSTTTPPTVSSVSRTVQPRDSWTANLQLVVPLVAPQRWVQWGHASEQVDVARLSAEDVRRQVAVITARSYVAVLSQHRLVDANQRAADNAREHLEDAKARLSAGTGNRLDLVRDSYADFLPLLTGVAQPFASSFTSLTSPTTGWLAQLVLILPLYDGGFRYGALEQRRAERDQARELLDAALRQARSDVRTGFEAMQRADASSQQAREASRLAGEALDITTLAYHAGATNDLEVVDAQRRARDAANAAAVAEDAARQARIDLLAATGRFP